MATAAAAAVAFFPGHALPDNSGCWDGKEFTFEKCCASWTEDFVGVGTDSCWTRDFSYERCCKPRDHPRDLFSCNDRGLIWRRFRRDMILGVNFARTQLGQVIKRHVSECLLGGLISTLVHLVIVATEASNGRVGDNDAEVAYQQAELLLTLMLRSPVSLEEVLLSGWPIGGVLSTLRQVPWVRDRAMALAGDSAPLNSEEMRLCAAVTHALVRCQRMPLDVALAFLADSSGSSHPEAMTTAFWSAAFSLRAYELPRAAYAERTRLAGEVSRLLRLGDQHWRAPLLRPGAGGPLAALLAARGPVVELLQVLQFDALVVVNPLSLLEDGLHFRGLPPDLVQRLPSTAPPLELQVSPRYDSVSNQAVAFEPMPDVAGPLRRAAAAIEEAHPLRVEIRVREMALADRAGRRVLGVPTGSMAEATFQDCAGHYGAVPGGCKFQEVQSETVDRLLLRSGGPKGEVVDLLKVHVQGDELLALRGARRSLQRGRICALMLKVSSCGLGSWSAEVLSNELHGLLRGLSAVMVAPNGTAIPLGPPSVLAKMIDGTRRTEESLVGWQAYDSMGRRNANPMDLLLVAWAPAGLGGACRRSPVARTAQAMWGAAAEAVRA